MVISAIMTDSAAIAITADQIKDLRAILAVIQREAVNKGVAEIVDLAQKANEIVAGLSAQSVQRTRGDS